MKVKDRMTTPVQSCRPEDSLAVATRILWEHDCGCVPVVDARHTVVGIVTDRDACMAAYTRGQRLEEIPVHAAMARKVFCCRADDTLEAAELLLRANQVRRLPVVDNDRRLVGLLSITDLVREAIEGSGTGARSTRCEQLVQTMAAICASRRPVATRKAAPPAAVTTPTGTTSSARPQAAPTPSPAETATASTTAPTTETTSTRPTAKERGKGRR